VSDEVTDPYLLALGRERAMYASGVRFERVMMVDAHLAELGYGADDAGAVRKLPKVERALGTPVAKRPATGQRERAVVKAPETAVPED
jgi:hypothetical protein